MSPPHPALRATFPPWGKARAGKRARPEAPLRMVVRNGVDSPEAGADCDALPAGRLYGRARGFVAPSSGPSGHLPPRGEGYFLSFDAQGGHDGLFPGAHLLFLGAFVQVVVAQQVEDGVDHQIAQFPLLRVAVLRRLGPDPL